MQLWSRDHLKTVPLWCLQGLSDIIIAYMSYASRKYNPEYIVCIWSM